MPNLLSLLLCCLFALSFTACTDDGAMDTQAVKEFADQLQQKMLTKEEFRTLAEKEIEKKPLGEQAEARRELDKFLSEWPTEAELDRKINAAIEEFADEAPTRAEVEAALEKVAQELPSKGEIKTAVNSFIDELPEGDELGGLLKSGLNTLIEAMDSLKIEAKKE